MLTIAITGGVACGKSTVIRLFTEILGSMDLPLACFDADAEVHLLLTKAEVLVKLREEFGSEVLTSHGDVNRGWLRDVVFADANARRFLENLLHPLVLDRAKEFLTDSLANSVSFSFLEIPLLYEVDFPLPRDLDMVVAISVAEQRRRLREERSLSDDQIGRVLGAQLPIAEKVKMGHLLIWNDLNPNETKEQVWLACQIIRSLTKQ